MLDFTQASQGALAGSSLCHDVLHKSSLDSLAPKGISYKEGDAELQVWICNLVLDPARYSHHFEMQRGRPPSSQESLTCTLVGNLSIIPSDPGIPPFPRGFGLKRQPGLDAGVEPTGSSPGRKIKDY